MPEMEEPQTRLDILAMPKTISPKFDHHKTSVYWIDKYPFTKDADGTTQFGGRKQRRTDSATTPRIEDLATPKWANQQFVVDRETAEWPVSKGAMKADPSPRVSDLANPKTHHKHYLYDRPLPTSVEEAAKKASASSRVESLSTPLRRKTWTPASDTLREGEFSQSITNIPGPALKAKSSARVEFLAEAKKIHPSYLSERSALWDVAPLAQKSQATNRLQQLSRPKSARLRRDDFDPYKVSFGAKNATASPRLAELSFPIPRKVKSKFLPAI